MAIKTVTTSIATSDISGAEGAETVEFGLHGAHYELELTSKEIKEFEKALAPYLKVARKAASRRATAKSAGPKNSPEFLAQVRAWARKNGHEVSDRGQVKKSILEAYNAAN